MTPNPVDLDLITLQAATLFVLNAGGRIDRTNDPDNSTGPRLYMAGCRAGNIAHLRQDIEEETARAINDLIATEPPLVDPDAPPVHLDQYVDLLETDSPVRIGSPGLNYAFPPKFKYEHAAELVWSDTPEGDHLLSEVTGMNAMPEALAAVGFRSEADFWPPWCVALQDGEIASICISARLGPKAAEAGVTTIPAQRGRGLGATAVASWATHPALRGRTPFYSTQLDNVSSQRVAARLGLRYLGASLSIR